MGMGVFFKKKVCGAARGSGGMSMDRKVRIKDGDKCIHCHLCQKHCSFPDKVRADIGDTVKLRELAYHCFYAESVLRYVR